MTSSGDFPHQIIPTVATLVCVNARHRLPDGPPSALIETENAEYDEEGHKLFEGDMVLDQAQLEFLQSPIDLRKAFSDLEYRWPNGRVPFRISEASQKDRAAILLGIQHWEENSCVRFNEVPDDYVGPHLIFSHYAGCWSSVGQLYYQPDGQAVSIGPGCSSMGVVAHEIGHALGFYHEQSRPDRDEHVVVLSANIDENMKHNFQLHKQVNNYDLPYDLTSLMHYGSNGFSNNGKNTLVTKNPLQHFVIGQRDGLSFYDKKLGNAMYNCSANCGDRIRCENEGYVDENCRCVCSPGFSGQTCREGRAAPEEKPSCGGPIFQPTNISSPNYPEKYPANTRCVWAVIAPSGQRVRAQFSAFEMLNRWDPEKNNWCIWDVFELRTKNLHDGEMYCDKELMGKTVISQLNTMVLAFSTQSDYYTGFEAQIDFV